MEDNKRSMKLGILKDLLNMSKDSQKEKVAKAKGSHGVSVISITEDEKPLDTQKEAGSYAKGLNKSEPESNLGKDEADGFEEAGASSVEPDYPNIELQEDKPRDPMAQEDQGGDEVSPQAEENDESDDQQLPEPKMPDELMHLVKMLLASKKK